MGSPADSENNSTPQNTSQNSPTLCMWLVASLAVAKLLIHLLTNGRYGYFRDELYYLDAARHLDWGYVDFAPLVAAYARVGLALGGSFRAIRLISAVAGAATVAATMIVTQQLGGRRFAQGLAGLAIVCAPIYLAFGNLLSMNPMEPLLWTTCLAILIHFLKSGDSRWWIGFGFVAGIALENKHSTAFFGIAVIAAMLLTEHRREFRKPWIWLGGAAALAIFLPNLIWEVAHHFPTLEDLENVRRSGKNVVLGPLQFVLQQILIVGPAQLPLWVAGLVSFFRDAQLRILGWTFTAFFLVMYFEHAKGYYLAGIYPMLLAGGAVAFERWFGGRVWPRAVAALVVALAAVPIAFLVLPILSPERYVAYERFLHAGVPKTEVHHESVWPQMFADQIGWEQLVQEVATIYWSLDPAERARTGIYASNYGEAGAIDLFGPRFGLPKAICAHQNYYYWGPPDFHGSTLIVLQGDRESLESLFQSVKVAGVHYNAYGMGEENHAIYLCRGPTFTFVQIWPQLKHWN
ncbi:MAG: glycosyltransferase family 39 protein [Candidatus Acidiferrales bacterium]